MAGFILNFIASCVSKWREEELRQKAQKKLERQTLIAARKPNVATNLFFEALGLVPRLHHHLLMVIQLELSRQNRTDIDPMQALIIHDVGTTALRNHFYSAPTFSIVQKQLIGKGFLDGQSVPCRLTEKGQEIRHTVDAIYQKHIKTVLQVGGISDDELTALNMSMRRLDSFWQNQPFDKFESQSTNEPYVQTAGIVHRLHHRLLEVIELELSRNNRDDLNAAQALILHYLGDFRLTSAELERRNYFYPVSEFPVVKTQLVDSGFIDFQRFRLDRRSVRCGLTEKGQEIRRIVEALYQEHAYSIEQVDDFSTDDLARLAWSLNRLDRFWNDFILYKL